MPELDPKTLISIQPFEVLFRLELGWGTRCVRVSTQTLHPRISGWIEKWTGHGSTIEPMSLTLDEIQMYIGEALERLEKKQS